MNTTIKSNSKPVSSRQNKGRMPLVSRSLDFFRNRFFMIYLTGIDLLYILYK